MSAVAMPQFQLVAALPRFFEQTVPESFVDGNGHMNIRHYFDLGAWGPWTRMLELGMPEDYVNTGSSFFTVGHHIQYFNELRLGDRFAVHAGFAERTRTALHSVGFVVDLTRQRVACMMDIAHVHVSMRTRRASTIPPQLSLALDNEINAASWLKDTATGIDLKAPRPTMRVS